MALRKSGKTTKEIAEKFGGKRSAGALAKRYSELMKLFVPSFSSSSRAFFGNANQVFLV